MGSSSSAPKYMDEIRVSTNDNITKIRENFDNKNNYKYLYIFILTLFILFYMFLLFFNKNRYKDQILYIIVWDYISMVEYRSYEAMTWVRFPVVL